MYKMLINFLKSYQYFSYFNRDNNTTYKNLKNVRGHV